MMSRSIFSKLLIGALIIMVNCVELYEPKVVQRNPNFLVVDGYIHSSLNTAVVRLSRTQRLYADEIPAPVKDATVTIEDDADHSYAVPQLNEGLYLAQNVNFTPEQKYRLRIQIISNGVKIKEYLSEYVPLKISPPIDSVTWDIRDDELQISVNTHDDTNKTRYYRWNTFEAWQYNARYRSLVSYDENFQPVWRQPEDYIDKCWETSSSTEIMIGTSVQLAQDVIRKRVLQTIPKGSVKFAWRYSIIVQQQALSEEAYSYWQSVKKTSESLGGLFDPLPSQVIGNITCVTSPDEPVLGYWDGGVGNHTVLFIDHNDVPADFYRPYICKVDSISLDQLRFYNGPVLYPITDLNNNVVGYTKSSAECSDCRAVLKNGTTTKPSFWN
jgi:hypothetical protein